MTNEAIECELCGHAYPRTYLTETFVPFRGGEIITHCHDCRPVRARPEREEAVDAVAAAARRVIEGARAPDRGDGYTGLEGRPSGTRVSVDLDDLLALSRVLPREVTNV